MELKLIRQTTGVGILLTVEDAVKAYKDPERLQNEIGSMLRGGGIDPETGEQSSLVLAIEDNGIRSHLASARPQLPERMDSAEEAPVKCPDCGKELKSKIGLGVHQARFCPKSKSAGAGGPNTTPASLKCPHCGKKYRSEAWLERHVKAEHEKPEDEPQAEPEKVPAIGKLPADLPEWLEEYIDEGDDEDEDGDD